MPKGVVESIEMLTNKVTENREVINELVENLNHSFLVKKQNEEEIAELKKRIDKLEGRLRWKRTDLN